MGKLTTQEKARRYDALQCAIELKTRFLREQLDADLKAYGEAPSPSLIDAYRKGQADAFGLLIHDLERWLD